MAQGSAEAALNLGYLYAVGRGVGKDSIEACALFRVAASRGQSLASANLADIEPTLSAAHKVEADKRARAYGLAPALETAQLKP